MHQHVHAQQQQQPAASVCGSDAVITLATCCSPRCCNELAAVWPQQPYAGNLLQVPGVGAIGTEVAPSVPARPCIRNALINTMQLRLNNAELKVKDGLDPPPGTETLVEDAITLNTKVSTWRQQMVQQAVSAGVARATAEAAAALPGPLIRVPVVLASDELQQQIEEQQQQAAGEGDDEELEDEGY